MINCPGCQTENHGGRKTCWKCNRPLSKPVKPRTEIRRDLWTQFVLAQINNQSLSIADIRARAVLMLKEYDNLFPE